MFNRSQSVHLIGELFNKEIEIEFVQVYIIFIYILQLLLHPNEIVSFLTSRSVHILSNYIGLILIFRNLVSNIDKIFDIYKTWKILELLIFFKYFQTYKEENLYNETCVLVTAISQGPLQKGRVYGFSGPMVYPDRVVRNHLFLSVSLFVFRYFRDSSLVCFFCIKLGGYKGTNVKEHNF